MTSIPDLDIQITQLREQIQSDLDNPAAVAQYESGAKDVFIISSFSPLLQDLSTGWLNAYGVAQNAVVIDNSIVTAVIFHEFNYNEVFSWLMMLVQKRTIDTTLGSPIDVYLSSLQNQIKQLLTINTDTLQSSLQLLTVDEGYFADKPNLLKTVNSLQLSKAGVYVVEPLKAPWQYTNGDVIAFVPPQAVNLSYAVPNALPAGVALNNTTGEIYVSDAGSLRNGKFSVDVVSLDEFGGHTYHVVDVEIQDTKQTLFYEILPPLRATEFHEGDVLAYVASLAPMPPTISKVRVLSGKMPAGIFVNQTNGSIYVKKPHLLEGGFFDLKIELTDGARKVVSVHDVTIEIIPDIDAEYVINAPKPSTDYQTNEVLAYIESIDGVIDQATLTGIPAWANVNYTTGQVYIVDNAAMAADLEANPGKEYRFAVKVYDVTGNYTTNHFALKFPTYADNEAVYTIEDPHRLDEYSAGYVLGTVTDGDGPIVSATVSRNALPSGVALDPYSGKLTVTNPTLLLAGTTNFQVLTQDILGNKTFHNITLTFLPLPVPAYVVDLPNNNQDAYINGETVAHINDPESVMVSVALVSGSIPAGMQLNTSTGEITVVNQSAIAVGTYSFTMSITDTGGAVHQYFIAITVLADHNAVYNIATPLHVSTYTNGMVLATVSDTDGAITSATLTSGTLPAGTSLNSVTGTITVSNAAALVAGTYSSIQIQTVDAAGGISSQYISLTFLADTDIEAVYNMEPPKSVALYINSEVIGTPYDADGAIVAASVSSGSLPAGVALNATTGVLTVSNHTLLVAGSYTFGVSTEDSTGGTTTQNVTITFLAESSIGIDYLLASIDHLEAIAAIYPDLTDGSYSDYFPAYIYNLTNDTFQLLIDEVTNPTIYPNYLSGAKDFFVKDKFEFMIVTLSANITATLIAYNSSSGATQIELGRKLNYYYAVLNEQIICLYNVIYFMKPNDLPSGWNWLGSLIDQIIVPYIDYFENEANFQFFYTNTQNFRDELTPSGDWTNFRAKLQVVLNK